MGIPGASRKGKKAWRKNIDDAEVVAAVQEQTHQARRPDVAKLQDHELFFEDKGPAAPDAAAAPQQQQQQRKKKREPRPTRAQLILAAPQAIKPVTTHAHPKRKDPGLRLPHLRPAQQQQPQQQQLQPRPAAADPTSVAAVADVWDSDGGEDHEQEGQADGQGGAVPLLKPVGPTSRASKRHRKGPLPAPRIKAVEVDMPGCSYNPEHEAHQDALAVLVATENKKLIRKELGPAPLQPALAAAQPAGDGGVDELDRLLRVDEADVDEDENEIALEQQQEGGARQKEEGGDGTLQLGGAGGEQSAAKKEQRKKTKKDRNREARAAAEARAAEERQRLKRQRRELEQLPALQQEVEEEEQYHEARRQRRKVVEEEKASIKPARLGKHKFEDLSVQVLTSDEVGHGLRRLKAFPMLATERFKSLQKRGLIEPRRPAPVRGPKRMVVYEKNARREKAVEGQEELDALKTKNKKKRKQLAAQR